MFYKILDNRVCEYANEKFKKEWIETTLCTVEEYDNAPNKYIVGDITIEVDVPDYEEQEVEKEIQVPCMKTITETIQEPIFDDEGNQVLDEEGNPTYKDIEVTKEVQETETIVEIVKQPKYDEDGNPVLDENGEQVFEDVEVKKEIPKYKTEIIKEKQTVQVGSHKETRITKGLVLNPNYEDEQAKEREEQFKKDFFNTSLGYIRRKVSMATGETKDFLSDLLPTISMGIQIGQPVQIIAYDKPDFTQEITDWTVLQNVKTVTAEFVQECFLQLSNDFKPVEVQDENTTDTTTDIQDELDTTTSKSGKTDTDMLE